MITALTDPTQMPNQLDDQETFDTKMANFLDNLAERARQENELAANMSAYAAGGAYAFPYVFDSSTADADPGVGKLRLSSATQNAATVMRLDLQAVGGADLTNVLADLRAVTSAVKGSIRVVKMTDPSKWLTFDVTAVALPTGYRNITMTWRATGGGQASPFANGDALMVFIDRNGDSGTVPGTMELLATITVSSAVASISLPTVLGADHDWFLVDIQRMELSTDQIPAFRFLSAGSPLVTGYNSTVVNAVSTGDVANFLLNGSGARSYTGILQLRNVKAAMKGIFWDGASFASSGGTNCGAPTRRGFHTPSTPAEGFEIFIGSGMINSALIRVYGVRKV
jgi:hypothetical protein